MLTLAFDIQLVRPLETLTLTPHSPIQINGDSGFVPANGVTGGSGISEDPYIIEGWDINASTYTGIIIRNTRAHFIIRNVSVHDGWTNGGFHSISLSNVTNGEVSGASITRNPIGIILAAGSSNNNISGNNITNNQDGIYLSDSSDNSISGNNITNNLQGIGLGGSSNNTFSDNNITANNIGINLYVSSNNVISGNNVTANNNSGIYLFESSNNTISENDISNNSLVIGGSGIMLDTSSNNTISRNNIIANNWWGINPASSNNNTIFGNNIRNNKVGFNSDSSDFNLVYANNIIDNGDIGIYLESSSNNTFYYNSLINNTNQVVVDLGYANNWDDSVEGNYWSNYSGVDLSHDGIGDTPNVIDVNNTDYYPLMGMFNCFNTSMGKQVNIISNSTIESFQYFASNSTIIMRVSNMTANQTHGFCRISIPYEVMSEPFNVTIDGADPTYWNYTLYDNGTHRWIYFEYEHSTRDVEIIPELRALTIISLLIITTLLLAIYKRRLLKTPVH